MRAGMRVTAIRTPLTAPQNAPVSTAATKPIGMTPHPALVVPSVVPFASDSGSITLAETTEANTTVGQCHARPVLRRAVVLTLDGNSYRLRDHHVRSEILHKATRETRRLYSEPSTQGEHFHRSTLPLSLSLITIGLARRDARGR
jgi:hypothetical protein